MTDVLQDCLDKLNNGGRAADVLPDILAATGISKLNLWAGHKPSEVYLQAWLAGVIVGRTLSSQPTPSPEQRIAAILDDPFTCGYSTARIAREVGVSWSTVKKLRDRRGDQPGSVKGSDGRTYPAIIRPLAPEQQAG